MDLTTLPIELQHVILAHLTVKDIISYTQINRASTTVCDDEILWRVQYLRRFDKPLASRVYSWHQLYIDRSCKPYTVIYHDNLADTVNYGMWTCTTPSEVATAIVDSVVAATDTGRVSSKLRIMGPTFVLGSPFMVAGMPSDFYCRTQRYINCPEVMQRYRDGLHKLLLTTVTDFFECGDIEHESHPIHRDSIVYSIHRAGRVMTIV